LNSGHSARNEYIMYTSSGKLQNDVLFYDKWCIGSLQSKMVEEN
jgi:hypothetical protein